MIIWGDKRKGKRKIRFPIFVLSTNIPIRAQISSRSRTSLLDRRGGSKIDKRFENEIRIDHNTIKSIMFTAIELMGLYTLVDFELKTRRNRRNRTECGT